MNMPVQLLYSFCVHIGFHPCGQIPKSAIAGWHMVRACLVLYETAKLFPECPYHFISHQQHISNLGSQQPPWHLVSSLILNAQPGCKFFVARCCFVLP